MDEKIYKNVYVVMTSQQDCWCYVCYWKFR